MINLNTGSWNLPKREGEKEGLEKSEYLNLPDLQFYLWCQGKLKLNRGVYNTIDNWFYEHGIGHIILRRIYLLAFLDYVKTDLPDQSGHKYFRFGNGGLTKMLQQFIAETNK